MPNYGTCGSGKAAEKKELTRKERAQQVQRWVGDQVYWARKNAGLTQEQLANEVDCSVDTIKRIEAGKVRDFTLLYFIAEALDISPASLLPPREADPKELLREAQAILAGLEKKL